MKFKLFVIVAFTLLLEFCSLQRAHAQFHYDLGLGLKVGSPWASATLKYFMNNASALEGLVHLGNFGVGVTALYEHHFMIGGVPGLRWYLGGGAHLAFQLNSYGYNPFTGIPTTGVYIGLDGVGGVEYKFEKLPLALGLDIGPLINFTPPVGVWWTAGIFARYTF
ncbi:MAG: hypothetical protein ACTTKZ_07780 [Bacteroides sp.]